MACFSKNRVLDSQYRKGTDGYRRMFVRLAGTPVLKIKGGNGSDYERIVAEESEIIIQWEGSPTYDSGYHAEHFPATMKGLKEARWRMKHMP